MRDFAEWTTQAESQASIVQDPKGSGEAVWEGVQGEDRNGSRED